ncbi:MAG: hypothetical protein HY863_11260 [Chloroflexi bacterium]|nr:hypothetical protein [Chloroflexota bacterium]
MKSFNLLRLVISIFAIVLVSCSNIAPVISTATVAPTPSPAPTSSPTPPPPPTVLLEPKLYDIDVAQLNETPQDILEQLYTFSPGAGGGGDSFLESDTPIWYSAYEGVTKPAFPDSLSWEVLGFAETPLPQVTLTLPNGTILPLEAIPWNAYFVFDYEIVPGSLLGTYSVEVVQGDVKLEDTVTVSLPTEPVSNSVKDIDWYAGFKPGEQITLHICENVNIDHSNADSYSDISEFNKYFPNDNNFDGRICVKKYLKTVTADEYGTFRVRVPYEYTYSVQADLSGVKPVPKCYDTLPQRLKVGDSVRVTDYGETIDYMTWESLTVGTEYKIVFGPICGFFSTPYEMYLAWVVESSDQTRRIVAESDDQGYYLELVNH